MKHARRGHRNQVLVESRIFCFPFFLFFFFFGCVGSLVLLAVFLQLQRAGATLRCGAVASHCGGFSCCGARAVGAQASVVVASGLSSCGARVQLLHSMWDLPGPWIEPVTPALAGGFLTTAPSGKSRERDLNRISQPSSSCQHHERQVRPNLISPFKSGSLKLDEAIFLRPHNALVYVLSAGRERKN